MTVLRAPEGVPAALVPYVVALLAWDAVAPDALSVLRRVADDRVGMLVEALLNPVTEFSVRRRLARVFSVCASQPAADGLVLGLADPRFEVRYQCARSLVAIMIRNPAVTVDDDAILAAVRRETTVGRSVWKGQRLLERLEETTDGESLFVDEFVSDRANRSLAHVFTLLSVVLPREPLTIAFRGLHTNDANLRGTALEYLEGVIPPWVREALWPYLEPGATHSRTVRPRHEVLEDLLRSNQSIAMNLAELRNRADRS